jgi:ankyrin repeat protein
MLLMDDYPAALSTAANDGSLPIHIACASKQSQNLMEMLVTRYPEALGVADCEGQLPLHVCCALPWAYPAVIALLLEHCPAAIEHMDHAGRTPLMVACENNEIGLEVLLLLLQAQVARYGGLVRA